MLVRKTKVFENANAIYKLIANIKWISNCIIPDITRLCFDIFQNFSEFIAISVYRPFPKAERKSIEILMKTIIMISLIMLNKL